MDGASGVTFPDRLEIIPFDGPISAVVRPPGSKSITNRALLAAGLATGRSVLRGALLADDTEAMVACIRGLGATVAVDDTTITVDGIDGRIAARSEPLDANQSGTTARFVAAALLLAADPVTLDADGAMRRRPMAPTIDALRSLGATVSELGDLGHLPITVTGPRFAPGTMPVVRLDASASSQFASGLLLAAPCLPDGLRVELEGAVVSRPYLDMTVAVMASFGAVVETPSDDEWIVRPGGYRSADLAIEPDASGASYFFAAAAITGGVVTVDGLGVGSLQGDLGFVDVLERMGATVERSTTSTTVRGGPLHGIDVDMADLSDTAQTLAAVAAFADGPTCVRGIGFIRAKETDRIAAVVAEMHRLGVGASEDADGFSIEPTRPHGGEVHTYDDHRMAMSMALVGLIVPGVVLLDPGCVRKTFPTYFALLESMRPGGSS